MNPRSPSSFPGPRRLRRWPRWGAGAVALLLMPKCLVCVAGYIALAAGFGFAGAEICGSGGPDWLAATGARFGLSPRQTAVAVLAAMSAAGVVLTLVARRIFRRGRAGLSEKARSVR